MRTHAQSAGPSPIEACWARPGGGGTGRTRRGDGRAHTGGACAGAHAYGLDAIAGAVRLECMLSTRGGSPDLSFAIMARRARVHVRLPLWSGLGASVEANRLSAGGASMATYARAVPGLDVGPSSIAIAHLYGPTDVALGSPSSCMRTGYVFFLMMTSPSLLPLGRAHLLVPHTGLKAQHVRSLKRAAHIKFYMAAARRRAAAGLSLAHPRPVALVRPSACGIS
ncbi:hypothetical protein DENSPDRAFT_59256 [Dentipellis sp. KUC8613]|nr:hypothetical protein DENSPDRAFT_59256 [Dentipellis sp. KUC8613]